MISRGFSLIEMIIVLGLLACGCIGAMSFFTAWYSGVAGNLDILRLRAHCQHAHMQAVKTQSVQQLVFDCLGYRINGSRYAFTNGVQVGGSYKEGALMGPSSEHKPLDKFITFLDKKITFYPDGMASAGLVYIGHKKSPYLYALSSGVSESFFLRVYRYEPSSWTLCLS